MKTKLLDFKINDQDIRAFDEDRIESILNESIAFLNDSIFYIDRNSNYGYFLNSFISDCEISNPNPLYRGSFSKFNTLNKSFDEVILDSFERVFQLISLARTLSHIRISDVYLKFGSEEYITVALNLSEGELKSLIVYQSEKAKAMTSVLDWYDVGEFKCEEGELYEYFKRPFSQRTARVNNDKEFLELLKSIKPWETRYLYPHCSYELKIQKPFSKAVVELYPQNYESLPYALKFDNDILEIIKEKEEHTYSNRIKKYGTKSDKRELILSIIDGKEKIDPEEIDVAVDIFKNYTYLEEKSNIVNVESLLNWLIKEYELETIYKEGIGGLNPLNEEYSLGRLLYRLFGSVENKPGIPCEFNIDNLIEFMKYKFEDWYEWLDVEEEDDLQHINKDKIPRVFYTNKKFVVWLIENNNISDGAIYSVRKYLPEEFFEEQVVQDFFSFS